MNAFLLIQNFTYVKEGYAVGMNVSDLLGTMWDLKYTFNWITGIIFIITSLLLSFNIWLFVEYYRLRAKALYGVKATQKATAVAVNVTKSMPGIVSTFASTIGTILAVIGVGCASCGAVAISLLLSLLGLTTNMLPFAGAEFGILGIIILAISCYTLWGKYKNPYIC